MSVELGLKIASFNADTETEDLLENVEKRLEVALDENIRLKSIIHDVTECNKRWQTYNGERQGYVQRLLTTIKELQQQQPEAEQQCEQMRALRQQLAESEQRCRRLEDDYEASRQNFRDDLHLLDIQVKMHRDDWEAEKRDKNEAMSMIKNLQEAIMRLNGKVFDLTQRSDEHRNTVYVCTCRIFANDAATCSVAKLRRRKFPNSRDVEILPCQLLPSKSLNPQNFKFVRSNRGTGDCLENSAFRQEEPTDFFSRSSSAPSSDEFQDTSSSVISSANKHSEQHGHSAKSISPSATLTGMHVRLPAAAPPSRTCRQQAAQLCANSHSDWLVCSTCRTRFSNDLRTQFDSHVLDCRTSYEFRMSE